MSTLYRIVACAIPEKRAPDRRVTGLPSCRHENQIGQGFCSMWLASRIRQVVICATLWRRVNRCSCFMLTSKAIPYSVDITRVRYDPGGVLQEYLGGDVTLGPWNPQPIPELVQLKFVALYYTKLLKSSLSQSSFQAELRKFKLSDWIF